MQGSGLCLSLALASLMTSQPAPPYTTFSRCTRLSRRVLQKVSRLSLTFLSVSVDRSLTCRVLPFQEDCCVHSEAASVLLRES